MVKKRTWTTYIDPCITASHALIVAGERSSSMFGLVRISAEYIPVARYYTASSHISIRTNMIEAVTRW